MILSDMKNSWLVGRKKLSGGPFPSLVATASLADASASLSGASHSLSGYSFSFSVTTSSLPGSCPSLSCIADSFSDSTNSFSGIINSHSGITNSFSGATYSLSGKTASRVFVLNRNENAKTEDVEVNNRCQAEPVEAYLVFTLRQAQGDRNVFFFPNSILNLNKS